MLAAGELFTLIVYAQLILEKKTDYAINDELLEEVFRFLIVDFSKYGLEMLLNHNNTETQREIYEKMIKRPASKKGSSKKVFVEQVEILKDIYRMSE